ncbi:hypothetical protein [Sinorhizobium meliloti]|uniref:hypothetical protein n=1 Tax=Rhizobium meliloti TaxID=382 RepID=UPI000309E19D|nr:hypothetical protein [Sinorhizobium meliloti]
MLDYAVFDFGLNSGACRTVKTLQKVVGVRKDGHVGEQTLAAVRKYAGGVITPRLLRIPPALPALAHQRQNGLPGKRPRLDDPCHRQGS